jgi:peptidoglycan/xylan/chitin deacetylase (PgdA/CDA1 family)
MCFDDGWAGAVRCAAPLLRQRGIPAFFFVTTAFLGRTFFATPEDLRQLDPLFFTIGSHGSTHRMLSSLSTDQIRSELVESKRRLEEILSRPVTCLSVPGGAVDSRVVDIAQEVGYSEVFTSAIGVNPTRHGRFGIARVAVTKATSAEMVARWLLFRLGRERLRKAILAVPKKILGMSAYSKLRRVLMGEALGYDHLFEP